MKENETKEKVWMVFPQLGLYPQGPWMGFRGLDQEVIVNRLSMGIFPVSSVLSLLDESHIQTLMHYLTLCLIGQGDVSLGNFLALDQPALDRLEAFQEALQCEKRREILLQSIINSSLSNQPQVEISCQVSDLEKQVQKKSKSKSNKSNKSESESQLYKKLKQQAKLITGEEIRQKFKDSRNLTKIVSIVQIDTEDNRGYYPELTCECNWFDWTFKVRPAEQTLIVLNQKISNRSQMVSSMKKLAQTLKPHVLPIHIERMERMFELFFQNQSFCLLLPFLFFFCLLHFFDGSGSSLFIFFVYCIFLMDQDLPFLFFLSIAFF